MKKYKYDELEIEITRKCNMQCEHCLRGEAENVTMSKDVIDRIFEDAADCNSILFTGGEPLLAIDEIEYFIEKLLASDWTTSTIRLSINGTILNPKLIDIANEFCQSKAGRMFQIFISDDQFHDQRESQRALEFYQNCKHEMLVFVVYSSFQVGEKKIPKFSLAGRAVDYYKKHPEIGDTWLVGNEEKINHRVCIVDNVIKCTVYVTANGDIGAGVGESFQNIDKLAFGNILITPLSKSIDTHNAECLLSCYDVFLMNQYLEKQRSHEFESNYGFAYLLEAMHRTQLIVVDRVIAARQRAKELYPLLSAYDIITAIPMPDLLMEYGHFKRELMSHAESHSRDDITRYADEDLVTKLATVEYKSQLYEALTILAILRKQDGIHNSIYGNDAASDIQEFNKLAKLNHQYETGEMQPDNAKLIPCIVDGKDFIQQELEKSEQLNFSLKIKPSNSEKENLKIQVGQLQQLKNIVSEGLDLLANPAKLLSTISLLRTRHNEQQTRISRKDKIRELEQKATELERRRKEILK